MKWLIGEIGVSLLIASLIGLLVGWMISHFFRSRALGQNRNRYEGALHERDREIRRLRSDLQGRSRRSGRPASARPGSAPRPATPRQAPTQASTQAGVASGRAPIARPPMQKPAPASSARATESTKTSTKRPAIGQPGKYAVAAKDMRGDSASLRVRSDAVSQANKKAVDDEAYAKIKAFAALGERDRQLQLSLIHI